MPAPDGVAPGSKVVRATSPSLVSHSCSRLHLGGLAGPLAALEGDEHAAAGQPPPRGGVAAQRGDDVGQQRHGPAVVHLAVGQHADAHGQQPGDEQHDPLAGDRDRERADVDRVPADQADPERHDRQRQDQRRPDQRLHDRERAAAHLVLRPRCPAA